MISLRSLEWGSKRKKMEMWKKVGALCEVALMLIGAHKVKQAPPRSHDL